MNLMKNTTLKKKLILIIFGIALVSQLITFTILSIERYSYLKSELTKQSHIQAQLIGEYSVSPLIFEDIEGLNEVLQRIEAFPFILSAAVYDIEGNLITANNEQKDFEIHQRDIRGNIYLNDVLHIREDIKHNEISYGSIHLIVSTTSLKKSFYNQIGIFCIIVLIMAIIIYFSASKMQRIISKPILDLAETAQKISVEGDYSIRLARDGSDEISQLYNSFNKMIHKTEERRNERDKALAVVQEQYDRFLTIFNAFPEIVYVVDPETYKILFVNSTLAGMYDYELVGKDCFEAFHHNPQMCSFCKMSTLNKLGDEVFWEHHNTNFDRHYLVMDKLIKWPDGRIVSMEVAIDITTRKKNERELKKHKEHLEELVKERTNELETQNVELERFNKLFIGREFRIKELREKLKKLEDSNENKS